MSYPGPMGAPTPLLPATFRHALRLFDVAAHEVARHYRPGHVPADLYELLAPAGAFEPGDVVPYRAHCREVLRRVQHEPALVPEPTEAEVLVLLERTKRDGVLSSPAEWLRQVLVSRVRYGGDAAVPQLLAPVLARVARRVPRWRQA